MAKELPSGLLKECLVEAKARRITELYKRVPDMVIISNTLKEGEAFAKGWGIEKPRIYTTPNGIRGHCFGKAAAVYITTAKQSIWKVLAPALDGAKVFVMLEKKKD